MQIKLDKEEHNIVEVSLLLYKARLMKVQSKKFLGDKIKKGVKERIEKIEGILEQLSSKPF